MLIVLIEGESKTDLIDRASDAYQATKKEMKSRPRGEQKAFWEDKADAADIPHGSDRVGYWSAENIKHRVSGLAKRLGDEVRGSFFYPAASDVDFIDRTLGQDTWDVRFGCGHSSGGGEW